MENPIEAPRSGEVGALLRVTRERANMTMRDVADSLRIRMGYLEAIESGEYALLPGATYAVGFVRAYAEHLGLDSQEIVRRFKAESAITPQKNDLDMPIPVSDGGLPSGAAILLGIMVIGGIYGAWYVASSADRPVTEMVQEVPDRFMALLRGNPDDSEAPAMPDAVSAGQQVNLDAPEEDPVTAAESASEPETLAAVDDGPTEAEAIAEPVPEPVVDAAPEPVAPAPAPAPVAAEPELEPEVAATPAAPVEDIMPPAEEDPVPVEEGAAAVEDVPEPPQPVAEPPAQAALEAPAPPAAPEPEDAAPDAGDQDPALASMPDDGQVFGAENTDARVIVRARQDSWVQVRDNDGLLLTRLLRAGDSYRVPMRDGLRLMTGNAGGLLLEVDGSLLPPLGGDGEVRRNIPLDVASLRSGAATPN